MREAFLERLQERARRPLDVPTLQVRQTIRCGRIDNHPCNPLARGFAQLLTNNPNGTITPAKLEEIRALGFNIEFTAARHG